MSTHPLPWLIGFQADSASAEDRERFVRQMTPPTANHKDWILLSTCHRAELYGFGPAPQVGNDSPTQYGGSAVRHLFRVAAGLESAIVGEDEVLHQVREALALARGSRALDTRLARMFEMAISAGRHARATRSVAAGNLAQRAMDWLQQRTEITGRPLLVVGAGRMGSALAHVARRIGSEVTIASRNQGRAVQLARIYGGRGVGLAEAAEVAPSSVAVAVALAGEWKEFRPIHRVLPPIADISAPSAISSSITARLNGGFLSIDDLYVRGPVPLTPYAEVAGRIVEAKAHEFGTWLDRLT